MKDKFKVGDVIIIKKGVSRKSKEFNGKIAIVTKLFPVRNVGLQRAMFTDLFNDSGIWQDEAEFATKLGKALE